MIEVNEVTKRYGETLAVDHLSFAVKPGTVTGFLGPNGAGKTTTMRNDPRPRCPHQRRSHRQRPALPERIGPDAPGRRPA